MKYNYLPFLHTKIYRENGTYESFLCFKFQMELENFKKVLSQNAQPQKFIDIRVFKFLNNIFEGKQSVTKVQMRELAIVPP